MPVIQFTSDQIERIRRARRVLSDLIPDFADARACGVECEALERMREAADLSLAEVESRFIDPQLRRQANAGQ